MGFDVTININLSEVTSMVESKITNALEMCGMEMENRAKEYLTEKDAVDTGALRNSVVHTVVDHTAIVGSDSEYAFYVETGTGIYVGGGRDTPWAYQDAKGNWHMTRGQPAREFIKPAVADHVDEYKSILESQLKG